MAEKKIEDKHLIEIVNKLSNNEFIYIEYRKVRFFLQILEFKENKRGLENSEVEFNMFYKMDASYGNYLVRRIQGCIKKLNELDWFRDWLNCLKEGGHTIEALDKKTFDYYFRNKIWF